MSKKKNGWSLMNLNSLFLLTYKQCVFNFDGFRVYEIFQSGFQRLPLIKAREPLN